MDRVTVPFRARFEEEVVNLESTFRAALVDLGRRRGFDELLRAWSEELEAMSSVDVPSFLDRFYITAMVANRRRICELTDQLNVLESEVDELSKIFEKKRK